MLEGIVVVEFSRIFSAPLCGMVLSDLGARVIKVERKLTGDESRHYGKKLQNGMSDYFFALNRNKEMVALDLKEENDFKKAVELIRDADVLLHNSLQSSFDRLGLSYESVKRINPRIIYAAVSGYGAKSKYRDNPSQDVIIQGLSGFMSLNGYPGEEPVKTGVPVVDYVTGLYLCIGVLAAINEREVTGLGRRLDVSLLESALSLNLVEAVRFLNTGIVTTRNGNRHTSIAPYNSYKTQDSQVLAAIANDAMFERFAKVLGLSAAGYETNEKRLDKIEELEKAINAETVKYKTKDLVKLLKENKISTGPVNDLAQAFDSDEIKALDITGKIDGFEYIKVPVSFS